MTSAAHPPLHRLRRYRRRTEPLAPEVTVSAQTDGPYGPLIPMPELTPDALRVAVARIAPSRIDAEPGAAAGLRPLLGRVRGDRTASGAGRATA